MSRSYEEPDMYAQDNLIPTGYNEDGVFSMNYTKPMPGICGGKAFGNAIEIRIHYNYSGSGPVAFGASYWPHVSLEMSFPAKQEKLAVEFAQELEKLVQNFQQRYLDILLPPENI